MWVRGKKSIMYCKLLHHRNKKFYIVYIAKIDSCIIYYFELTPNYKKNPLHSIGK